MTERPTISRQAYEHKRNMYRRILREIDRQQAEIKYSREIAENRLRVLDEEEKENRRAKAECERLLAELENSKVIDDD